MTQANSRVVELLAAVMGDALFNPFKCDVLVSEPWVSKVNPMNKQLMAQNLKDRVAISPSCLLQKDCKFGGMLGVFALKKFIPGSKILEFLGEDGCKIPQLSTDEVAKLIT